MITDSEKSKATPNQQSVVQGGDSPPIRTIRLEEAALNKVVEALQSAPASPPASKRKTKRFPIRMRGCVLSVQVTNGASVTNFAVVPFDLSASGIGILHGGFVYPRTKCYVRLISTHGSWQIVEGVVRTCTMVQGNLHSVGISFNTRVDPADYTHDAVSMRVLVVDDSLLIQRLMINLLKDRNIVVDVAANGREGIDRMNANRYDIVFMDVEMPEMDGIQAIRKLREEGHTETVVASSAISRHDAVQACLDAGFDRFLPKPCSKDQLSEVLNSIRQEPLVSTLADDHQMRPLINEFVQSLPSMTRLMQQHLIKSDRAALEQDCRNLKGAAGSFGFGPIFDAAADLESSIIGKAGADKVKKSTIDLIKLCSAARMTDDGIATREVPSSEVVKQESMG